jgi:hypothetical protein
MAAGRRSHTTLRSIGTFFQVQRMVYNSKVVSVNPIALLTYLEINGYGN